MNEENWTLEISPKTSLISFNWKEIWRYRDLLFLFVRRDFVSVYKQTILGPLWFFIQPFFSTVVYTIIFGKVAKIPSDGIPHILFYMSGIVCWNYFADCLIKTSNTFVANQGIFGKVYFPRLIVPLSIVISNLFKFAIQFIFFIGFWIYYYLNGASIHFTYALVSFPLIIILMAMLGLGTGIIISSMTTKYRDFQFLVNFGVQLLMYATPVIYPVSFLSGKIKEIILLNPLSPVIESFKFAFLGVGTFSYLSLFYTTCFAIVILLLGIIIFNKVEKNFMDTV